MSQIPGKLYRSPRSGRIYLYEGKLEKWHFYKIIKPGPKDPCGVGECMESLEIMNWLVPEPEEQINDT